MHISSFNQTAEQHDDGLADISLTGLKRIIVLTGANGAGKSRLLNRVRLACSYPVYRDDWHRGIDGYLEPSRQNHKPASVDFVAKNLDLFDSANLTRNESVPRSETALSPGIAHLAEATLPYIERILTQWRNATHQDSPTSPEVKKEKIRAYNELKSLILAVLDATLDLDLDNNPVLFGKPIAKAGLSDGQKTLLQWCVALHAQNQSLSDLILLLDEPENHLHPESMIATINRIIKANSQGQVWIVTHSVPLIASLYRDHGDELSLYFMDKGRISYASRTPEKVLTSLMGGEANISALREFIDLPEVFATNLFASECLLPPDVVAITRGSDPEVGLVEKDIAAAGEKLKVLDFGCGKGRLLDSLIEKYGANLPNKVDYVGWDGTQINRQICDEVIQRGYGESKDRWFTSREELIGRHPTGSFDRVVLCNVLHEIDPSRWIEQFNRTSIINQCLNDSGSLVIIEDYLMPKGEYAHPFGFIVLDTEAIQKLFVSTSREINVKSEREGRIKAHFVPKKLLANVSHDSVMEALEFAQRQAREKIEAIRLSRDVGFKTGRAHGFWVQQYTNTSLAIGRGRGSFKSVR